MLLFYNNKGKILHITQNTTHYQNLIKPISDKMYSDSLKWNLPGGFKMYFLNCNEVVGNMVYLTDLDYNNSTGHKISEVRIFGIGEILTPVIRSNRSSRNNDC